MVVKSCNRGQTQETIIVRDEIAELCNNSNNKKPGTLCQECV